MTGLLIGLMFSQGLWAKTFGGSAWDVARSVIQTADGGYAIVGYTYSFGAGSDDLLVLKLASDGSLSWAKTFGDVSTDEPHSIIQTADGGYVVTGRTYGPGDADFLILKLASDGSLTWAKKFVGWSFDDAYSIIQTADGGYVVAGPTGSYGAGNGDFLVLKLTSDGSRSWAKTFGGLSYEWPYSVAKTVDGGCAIAGITQSFGAGRWDFFVIKLISDGSLTWAKTFGGASDDWSYSIIQPADGYVIVGTTASYGVGNRDILVIKLALNTSLIWARTFGGPGDDWAGSVIQTADGGYAVGGYTTSFGAGNGDLLILKLASDGSLTWAKTFGGTSMDSAHSLIQTTDGGYAIAGYTTSFGAGSRDFLVLKLDSDGNYPGCVQDCSPTVTTPNLNINTQSVTISDISSNTVSLTLTETYPAQSMIDACTPLAIEERDVSFGFRITCSPMPGGLLFVSPEDLAIRIYRADGRVAYSGNLEKGENRIFLDRGVYLWQAGQYKEKAVVK
ncbi:MAG: hypothetical protein ABIN66_07925 [candidate division WOR-3 bacterium]